jgi:hypothetical protein
MRLALIYALMDGDDAIRRVHLEAALEVWRYAFEGARYVFGDSIGDPRADDAVRQLRSTPEGMTRTQLGQVLFGKHATRERLGSVLDVLHELGFARPQTERTEGRSAERWFATSGEGYEVDGGKGIEIVPPDHPLAASTPSPPPSEWVEGEL